MEAEDPFFNMTMSDVEGLIATTVLVMLGHCPVSLKISNSCDEDI